MKCPVCKDVNLVMTERQGIEIDYCPDCRGVWLDRGELDKIIERSAGATSTSARGEAARQIAEHGYGESQGAYKPKRRKSFLSELFD